MARFKPNPTVPLRGWRTVNYRLCLLLTDKGPLFNSQLFFP